MLSCFGTVRKSRSATAYPGGAVRDALARQHAKYPKQKLRQEESGSHTGVPSLRELSFRQLKLNPNRQPGYIHIDPRLNDGSDENVIEEVISEFLKSAMKGDEHGKDRMVFVEKVTGKLDEARNISPPLLGPKHIDKFNRKILVFEHGDNFEAKPMAHTSINNTTSETDLGTDQTSRPQEIFSSPQVILDTGHDNPDNGPSNEVKIEQEEFPKDPIPQPLDFEPQKDKDQESVLEEAALSVQVSLETEKDNPDISLEDFLKNYFKSEVRSFLPVKDSTLEFDLDSRSKEASLNPAVAVDTENENSDDRHLERFKAEKEDFFNSKFADQILVFEPVNKKTPELEIEQAAKVQEITLSPPVALITGSTNSDQKNYKENPEEEAEEISSSTTEEIPILRQNPILDTKEESSPSLTLLEESVTNVDYSDASQGPETIVDSEVARATPDAKLASGKESSVLTSDTPGNEDTKEQDLAEVTETPIEDFTTLNLGLDIKAKPQADFEATRCQEKKINFEWQVIIQAATIEARKFQYQASLDKCNETSDSVAKANLPNIKPTFPGATAKQKLASRWEKVLATQTSEQKPKDTAVKFTGTCEKKRPAFETGLNSTEEQPVPSTQQDAFHQHKKTSLELEQEHSTVTGQGKESVSSLQHRISKYKRNLDLDSKRTTQTVIASKINHGPFNLRERVEMYHRSLCPKELNTAYSKEVTKTTGVQGSPGAAKNFGNYKLAYEASLRGTQESSKSGSATSDDDAAVRRERRKSLEQRWLCHDEKTRAEKQNVQLEEKNILADSVPRKHDDRFHAGESRNTTNKGKHRVPFNEKRQVQHEQKLVSENEADEKKTDLADESKNKSDTEERESINGKATVRKERECFEISSEEQVTTDLNSNECKQSETEKKVFTKNGRAELNNSTPEVFAVDQTQEETSNPKSGTPTEERSKKSNEEEIENWDFKLKQTVVNPAETNEGMAEPRGISLQEKPEINETMKWTEQKTFSPGKGTTDYSANIQTENGTEEIELERSMDGHGKSTMLNNVSQCQSGKTIKDSLNSALGSARQRASTLPHSWIKDTSETGQTTSTSPETIFSTKPRNKAEFINSECSQDKHGRSFTSPLESKGVFRAFDGIKGGHATPTLSVRRNSCMWIDKASSNSDNGNHGQGTSTLLEGIHSSSPHSKGCLEWNKGRQETTTLFELAGMKSFGIRPINSEAGKDVLKGFLLPDSPDKDNIKVGHGTPTLPESPDKDNKNVGHQMSIMPASPDKYSNKVGHGTSTLPDSSGKDKKIELGIFTMPNSPIKDAKVGHGTSTFAYPSGKDINKVELRTTTMPNFPIKDKVGHGTSTLSYSLDKNNKVGHGTSTLSDSSHKNNKVGHKASTFPESSDKDKIGLRTLTLPDSSDNDNKVGHRASTLPDFSGKDNKVGHRTSTSPDFSGKDNKKVELRTPIMPNSPIKDIKVGHGTSTLSYSSDKDNKVGHGTSILSDSSHKDKVGHQASTFPDSSDKDNKVGHRTPTFPDFSDKDNKVGHRTSTSPDSSDKDNQVEHRPSTSPDSLYEDNKAGHRTSTLVDSPDKANNVGHRTSTMRNYLEKDNNVGDGTATLPNSQDKDNNTIEHGMSILIDHARSTKIKRNIEFLNPEFFKGRLTRSRSFHFTNLSRQRDKEAAQISKLKMDENATTNIAENASDLSILQGDCGKKNCSKDGNLHKELSKRGNITSLPDRTGYSSWKSGLTRNLDNNIDGHGTSISLAKTNIPSCISKEVMDLEQLQDKHRVYSVPGKNILPSKSSNYKPQNSKLSSHGASKITIQEQNDPDKTSYSVVCNDRHGTYTSQTKSLLSFWKSKEARNMDERKDGQGTSTFPEKRISARLNNGNQLNKHTHRTSILSIINKLSNKEPPRKSEDAPRKHIFAGTVRSPKIESKSPKLGEKDYKRTSSLFPDRTITESTYDPETAILPGKTGICSLCNKNTPISGLTKGGHGTSTLIEKTLSPRKDIGELKSELIHDGQELSILPQKNSPKRGGIKTSLNSVGTSFARRDRSPIRWRAGQNQNIDGHGRSVLPEDSPLKLRRKETSCQQIENKLQTEMAGISLRSPRKTKSSSLMGKFTNNTPTLQERIAQLRRSSGNQSCVRPSPTGNEEKPETIPIIGKEILLDSSSFSVGHQLLHQKHEGKETGRSNEKIDFRIRKFEKCSDSIITEANPSNFKLVTDTSASFGIDSSSYQLGTIQRTEVPANKCKKAHGLTFQSNISVSKCKTSPSENATPTLYKTVGEKQSIRIESYNWNDSTELLSDMRLKNVPSMDTTTSVDISKEKTEVEAVSAVQIDPAGKTKSAEEMKETVFKDKEICDSSATDSKQIQLQEEAADNPIYIDKCVLQKTKSVNQKVCPSKVEVDIAEIHSPSPKFTKQNVVPTKMESSFPEKTNLFPFATKQKFIATKMEGKETTSTLAKPTKEKVAFTPLKDERIPEKTTQSLRPIGRSVKTSHVGVSTQELTNPWPQPTKQEVIYSEVETQIPEPSYSSPSLSEKHAAVLNEEVNILETTYLISKPTKEEDVPSKVKDNIKETTNFCQNPTKEGIIPRNVEVSIPETNPWLDQVGPTKVEDNILEITDFRANSFTPEDTPNVIFEKNSKPNTKNNKNRSNSDMDYLPKENPEQVFSFGAKTELIQESSWPESLAEVKVTARAEEIVQKTDSVQTFYEEEDFFFNCIEAEDEEESKSNHFKVDVPSFYKQRGSYERQTEKTNTYTRAIFGCLCLMLLIFLLIFCGHLLLLPEPKLQPQLSIFWKTLSFLLSLA